MDPASFLAAHAPFDALGADRLAAVVAATDIVFFLRGEVIVRAGGEPLEHLYLVRTGSVELVDDSHVVDQQGEGEIFGAVSLVSGERPVFTVRASEETICYRIAREAASEALASPSGISFLTQSLRRRERTLLEHVLPAAVDPWTVPLEEIASTAVVEVPAEATITETAQRMAATRASSALVRTHDGWAIITDRDLRTRVLAEGRDAGESVGSVASSPLASLSADATAAEALSLMLERGIHHVPVMEAGAIRAIVTDTDLLALDRRSVLHLRRELETASNVDEVVARAGEVPRALADLVLASMDPLAIGHLAGVFRDAATTRLLELAQERLGPAPCPWVWIALGSQARHEQGMVTDQDHALVYDPDSGGSDAVDPYFAELTSAVTQALVDGGTPRCKAGVIAEEPEWRGSLDAWRERIAAWSVDLEPAALGKIAIALDHRPVAGTRSLAASFAEVVAEAGASHAIQRRLGRWVIDQRPPKGFLRAAIVEGRETSDVVYDVKHQGIGLITSLARVVGLMSGVRERRTAARLRAAVRAEILAPEDGSALEEAFALLWQVRLDHQAHQVRARLRPDDLIDPRTLGPLTRQGLKESFRRIDGAQRIVGLELGLS